MRLSDFIQANMEQIIHEWETFARTLPAAHDMSPRALRDHAKEILEFVIRDMDTHQTALSQSEKSKGHGTDDGGSKDSAAQIHAELRSKSGFDVAQLATEYRALRASIIKLWTSKWTTVNPDDISDLIRFNESIDQALMESIVRFKEKVTHSRNMFIGILGHDLRNPLGAIMMSNELLLAKGNFDKEQIVLASQIGTSAERMKHLIADLIEVTRINLGTGISITTDIMDMGNVGRQAAAEIQAIHPSRVISFEATGNLEGLWDHAHISQVFSNLIGNAVQHGSNVSPITITATGTPREVIISFHNEGIPIPRASLRTIFDSSTRVVKEGEAKESTSLGLGLYIAKQIVISHGGTIDVTSSKKMARHLLYNCRVLASSSAFVSCCLIKYMIV